MSIYLCITPFFPTNSNYRGPFVFDQVKALQRSGRFERIVVLKPGGWRSGFGSYVYEGVDVYLFPVWQLPSMLLPSFFDGLNKWSLFRRMQLLELAPGREDVVHVHSSTLAKYGAWIRWKYPFVKTLLQHHNLDPLCVTLGRVRFWGWHQRKAIANRVNSVNTYDWQIGVSQLVLDQLKAFPQTVTHAYTVYERAIKRIQSLKSVKMFRRCVLYNGVDLQLFFGDSSTNNASMPKDRTSLFRIGCVGNFQELKGQMTLVKAMQALTTDKRSSGMRARVVFVGDGPTQDACQEYIKRVTDTEIVQDQLSRSESQTSRLSFEFKKPMRHSELAAFYRSLDLFVLPSVFEGFGCVYLEAWACGVPFICCKGQGISEFIYADDADKWMITPGDHEELARKIQAYCEHRWKQRLKYPVDIDSQINGYLRNIVGDSLEGVAAI